MINTVSSYVKYQLTVEMVLARDTVEVENKDRTGTSPVIDYHSWNKRTRESHPYF